MIFKQYEGVHIYFSSVGKGLFPAYILVIKIMIFFSYQTVNLLDSLVFQPILVVRQSI